jgi:putative nucleotidyltransferase with HDIG domain
MEKHSAKPVSREASGAVSDRFLPVYVQSLWIDAIPGFDLYMSSGRQMVLYRGAHLPFTAESRNSLLETGVPKLYVPAEQRQSYLRYIGEYIGRILTDPSVDEFAKSSIVYDSAKDLVKAVLENPVAGENIQRSQVIVESMVQYIIEGPNVFHNLLRMMQFDYTVYSHSVNVCTFSLALATAAGMESTTALTELGTGALLHDIGKTRVSDQILHKPGPLEPEEMKTVQKHPLWGVELIQQTNLIPQSSYFPIRQHHERENGSGYPDGIGRGEIHVYSKIVAIADIFDAMTTERVYRHAVGSFAALKTMFEDKNLLDQNLLAHFVRLMGPTQYAVS